jgi:hypothetical protein
MTPDMAMKVARNRILEAWKVLDENGPDRSSVDGWIDDLQAIWKDMGNLKADDS